MFNVNSRIGSVIDSCFIVEITIGCDIEFNSVVDLATNDWISLFVFVMSTREASSYFYECIFGTEVSAVDANNFIAVFPNDLYWIFVLTSNFY